MSYLHPVRMFIFLNFIFFLIWFSLPGASSGPKMHIAPLPNEIGNIEINTSGQPNTSLNEAIHDSASQGIRFGSIRYQSLEEYDSLQEQMPLDDRHGFIKRSLIQRAFAIRELGKDNPAFFEDKIEEGFKHNLPKLNFLFLFISTFTLSLFYYRRHIYLINHAIFSIHVACTFLLLSILMLLINYIPHIGLSLAALLFLYGNYYFYRALRTVYQQGHGKTLIKFLLLNLTLAFFMLIGVVVNLVFATLSLKG
jgi:hypothetical protein